MSPRPKQPRRILGRVKRTEFVGRTAELERIVSLASQANAGREADGLLVLLAPLAGVSELLRQAYDELFNAQGDSVPLYFSLPASDTTAVSAAIEFLNAFLAQYIAFRRNDPSLVQGSFTMNDLVQLAPAPDLDWVEELVNAYNEQRFSNDERELVRFCLNAPRRVPGSKSPAFHTLRRRKTCQLWQRAVFVCPRSHQGAGWFAAVSCWLVCVARSFAKLSRPVLIMENCKSFAWNRLIRMTRANCRVVRAQGRGLGK